MCDHRFRFFEFQKFKTSWDIFNHSRWRSAMSDEAGGGQMKQSGQDLASWKSFSYIYCTWGGKSWMCPTYRAHRVEKDILLKANRFEVGHHSGKTYDIVSNLLSVAASQRYILHSIASCGVIFSSSSHVDNKPQGPQVNPRVDFIRLWVGCWHHVLTRTVLHHKMNRRMVQGGANSWWYGTSYHRVFGGALLQKCSLPTRCPPRRGLVQEWTNRTLVDHERFDV